jgi:uncharacterized Zn finger protein|tara:strand:- start:13416 stop:13595 length:180 start_codon:yes stop_codon:yes gene_type:complete
MGVEYNYTQLIIKMKDKCSKCGGRVFEVSKEAGKAYPLICTSCGELFHNREELNLRCCD